MDNTARIVISGYYGFDNIGDEAVLSTIISSLREYIPNVSITILSNNPEKTKKVYNVEAINRWNFGDICKAIKSCDLFISGGGSLLQDITSFKTIPYYLGIVRIALHYKKKVVFYSQGVGPVNKSFNKWLIKRIVSKVDHVFVRDNSSKELLQSLGVKAPVTVAADPVLGISIDKSLVNSIKNSFEEKKTAGICLRPWHNNEQIINSLLPHLKKLIKEGYDLYFLPMYYEQDLDIAKEIYDQLGDQAKLINKKLTIEETLAYTASFDFIIGMRLHSLIMATVAGTPVIGLSYDPKVKAFMDEMQMQYCIDINEISEENVGENLSQLIENLDTERQRLKLAYNKKIEDIYSPVIYIKERLEERKP